MNGKGETVRRSKQEANVYAKEEDVAAYVCRQCPDPNPTAEGETRVSVTWRQA